MTEAEEREQILQRLRAIEPSLRVSGDDIDSLRRILESVEEQKALYEKLGLIDQAAAEQPER
jgi:hypothetical protein